MPKRPEIKTRHRRRCKIDGSIANAGKNQHQAGLGAEQISRRILWSRNDENKHLKAVHRLREDLKTQGLILLLPEIRKIVKSGDQAICLCQMLYWFCPGEDGRPRARLRINGRPEKWMAKTVEEFGIEVGLDKRQARSSLDKLVTKKFIEKRPGGFCGRKTTFWRIVPGAIESAITKK